MSTCLEIDALPERLQEYTNVLSFVEERLSFSHHRSLFVFGACGCGKTSTVLRALRRVSHRPMSCDRFRTAPTDEISSPASSSGSGTSPISEAARRSVKRSRDSDVGAAVSPLVASLPNLFAANHRRVQGHYVNCADLTAAQLCDAVVASLRGVQPRLDAATRALIENIENLPKRAAATRRRATRTSLAAHFEEAADADTLHINNNMNNSNASAAASGGFVQNSSAAAPPRRSRAALTTPLHVMVLDEVEYVRAGAAATLTELAALSIECATQLALVFISNQRDLVHVPSALLKELPFAAYSAEELERIGANIIERSGELMRHSTVQLSSGLMTFIARKALHEHSGDVRQVAAMCRRLIHTAQDEIPGNETEKNNGTQRTPVRRRLSSGGAGGGSGVINASPPSPPAATIMQAPTLTLAQSHKVLRGPSVDQRVAEYVAGMPEQMLYVLSCLVALNVRQQRSKTQQSMAVGGALRGNIRSTTSAAEREPGTFTMRAVHQLYTALMAQQCFPSMNAAGIATAIEGFADLGILSRPQRRGNEDVFSFNGVWTLEAMQSALTARGEVICQERVDCGLDAGENRFAAVLRELSALVGA